MAVNTKVNQYVQDMKKKQNQKSAVQNKMTQTAQTMQQKSANTAQNKVNRTVQNTVQQIERKQNPVQKTPNAWNGSTQMSAAAQNELASAISAAEEREKNSASIRGLTREGLTTAKVDAAKPKIKAANKEARKARLDELVTAAAAGTIHGTAAEGQRSALMDAMMKAEENARKKKAAATEAAAVRDQDWYNRRAQAYGNLEANPNYAEISQRQIYGMDAVDDLAYAYINGDEKAKEVAASMTRAGNNPLAKYDYMTPEQKNDYRYIYATMGKEQADDYLEYISYELNAKQAGEYTDIWAQEAREAPVMASAASVGMNAASGAGFGDVALQLATKRANDYKPVDYNRLGSMPSQMTEAVRGTIAGDLQAQGKDKMAFLYQTGMSMADSLFALAGGIGGAGSAAAKVAGNFGTILLGGAAATHAMQAAHANGATDRQAFATGLAAGVAETVFEKVSLGVLLGSGSADTVAKFIKSVLKNAGVEGSEELFTDLANSVAEAMILGDKSSYNMSVQFYMSQGMSKEEAELKASREWCTQLLSDFFGGAISGGVFGAGYSGMGYAAQSAADRNYGRMLEESAPVEGKVALLEQARESGEDTLANALARQAGKKGKLSNRAAGRMARAVDEAIQEEEKAELKERAKGVDSLVRSAKDSGMGLIGTLSMADLYDGKANQDDYKSAFMDYYRAGAEAASGMDQRNLMDVNTPHADLLTPQAKLAAFTAGRQDMANGDVRMPYENVLRGPEAAQRETAQQAEVQTPTETQTPSQATQTAPTLEEAMQAQANMSVRPTQNTQQNTPQMGETVQGAVRNTPNMGETMQTVAPQMGETVQSRTKNTPNMGQRTVARAANPGLVRNDTLKKAHLPTSTIRQMDAIGKVSQTAIVLEPKMTDENGNEIYGSYQDGVLRISMNAPNPVMTTAIHEVVHRVRKVSPEAYDRLRDFVVNNASEAWMQRHLKARAKNYGTDKSADYLTEEIVADTFGWMLRDTKALERFVAEDRNAAQKLLDAVRDMINAVRRMINGQNKSLDPAYIAEVKKLQVTLEEAEVRLTEALKQTQEALEESTDTREAEQVAASRKVEAYTGDEDVYIEEDDGARYSMRSITSDLDGFDWDTFKKGKIYAALKAIDMTDQDVRALFNGIQDLVEYMIPKRDILDMNEEYGKEGRQYKPFKPNSDPLYKVSLDFSTLCRKRLMTQFVIEQLQLRENRPMSAEEQLAIRDMLNELREDEKALQVACAMCYVEAARLKSPKFVEAYLANPTPVLVNYFAKKSKAFAAEIKRRQGDYKVAHGYARNATKKDMSNADATEMNQLSTKWRQEYQPTAEEAAIIERAKALPNSTYLSAANLASLAKNEPRIYDAYTSYIRESTHSKALETGEPYYFGDSKKVGNKRLAAFNKENGLRFDSWSDFQFEHLLDMMMAVIDLSTRSTGKGNGRGVKMHGYTKFPEMVRIFGKTGMMFNLSGVSEGTGFNEDGSLRFSETESVNIEEAKAVRKLFPETAGIQCIGINDDHIRALLRSDYIDYVIPYHKSGMNATLRRMAKIHDWTDYEQNEANHQEAKKIPGLTWEKDGRGKCAKEEWQKEPVFSEFFVGYDTGMSGIEAMRASAERYVQMCRDRGLTPKFEGFLDEENYWKLLIDRKMINQITGELIEQKPVRPVFEFGDIKKEIDAYVKNYDPGLQDRALKYVVDHWNEVPGRIETLQSEDAVKATIKKSTEIERKNRELVKQVKKLGNEMLAAQQKEVNEQRGETKKDPFARTKLPGARTTSEESKLSRPTAEALKQMDEDYLAAVETGDMETAQRMVDEAAKSAGYRVEYMYRGDPEPYNVLLRQDEMDDNEYVEPGNLGYGIYFTPDEQYARRFGNVRKFYLKYDNVADVTNDPSVKAMLRQIEEELVWDDETNPDGFYDTGEVFDELISRLDADAVAGTGVGGLSYGAPEIAVRESWQAKLADPVTYRTTDDGRQEPIPLSERFNPEKEDIRYSRPGVREALDELIDEYGAIPPGQNPARDVQLPRRTEKGNKVYQTVRTVIEAKATPDDTVETLEELTKDGALSYNPISDKTAVSNARSTINNVGWEDALDDWMSRAKNGIVSKADTTMGWVLYNNAANEGDSKTALKVLEQMFTMQHNAAQALQATAIIKKLNPETQLYMAVKSVRRLQEELNEKYRGKKKDAPELKISDNLAEDYLRARSQKERDRIMEAIYRHIGQQLPSDFMTRWNAWRYLAMLGNVRTHVRNVIGNAGFAPMVAAKDLTATGIEKAVYALSGQKIDRTKAFGKGFADRLQAAWGDYENVADVIKGEGKYEEGGTNVNKIIRDSRHVWDNTGKQWWDTTVGKGLEKATRFNGEMLDKEDAWFGRPHYAFALAQYCAANNITPEQIKSGKDLDAARKYAISEAQKATYRDASDFAMFVSRLGRDNNQKAPINKAVGIVLEGILPFRKTPANILVRGLEYSPLGLVKSLTVDLKKVQNEDMTAADMIDHLSAGLVGTGLMALGILLSRLGLVRGRGDDDDDKKKFEELQGHQGYALELPNGTSITLDWLAPESLPFFVGVNLYEQIADESEGFTMDDILSAVGNITEPMLELSCLQGVNDVLESVSYAREGDLSAIAATMASAATSYITQMEPTILGQLERTLEDKRYTTYTQKGKFLTSNQQYALGRASARFPGLDYSQIPYIDAWGREELTGRPIVRVVNNFFNPAYTSKVNESDMEKELLRVYDATGENVFPQRPGKSIKVNGEQKDLTAEEYVEYATYRGQTAWQLLTKIVNDPTYKSLSDQGKAEAIKYAYQYADQMGKKQIADEFTLSGWVAKAEGNPVEAIVQKALGGDNDTGAAMARAGFSDTQIAKMENAIDALPVPKGQSEPTTGAKYRAVCNTFTSEKDRYNAMAAVTTKDWERYSVVAAGDIGVPSQIYASAMEAMPQYDADQNGSYKQAEIKAMLDNQIASGQIDRNTAAAVWQLLAGTKSTKNNPYNKGIGQTAVNAMAAAGKTWS